jgi:hypothetical protein
MHNKTQEIIKLEEFAVVVISDATNYNLQAFPSVEPALLRFSNIIDQYANETGESAYGIFVSENIDYNSMAIFQRQFWYRPDDSKIPFTVIPLTGAQYESFSRFFEQPQLNASIIREKLLSCLQFRQFDAPTWKKEIDRIMQ